MISEDKYTRIFSQQIEVTVFILPAKYFSTLMNSLAFFFLEIFTFLCSLVRRNEYTKKIRPRQSTYMCVSWLHTHQGKSPDEWTTKLLNLALHK